MACVHLAFDRDVCADYHQTSRVRWNIFPLYVSVHLSSRTKLSSRHKTQLEKMSLLFLSYETEVFVMPTMISISRRLQLPRLVMSSSSSSSLWIPVVALAFVEEFKAVLALNSFRLRLAPTTTMTTTFVQLRLAPTTTTTTTRNCDDDNHDGSRRHHLATQRW